MNERFSCLLLTTFFAGVFTPMALHSLLLCAEATTTPDLRLALGRLCATAFGLGCMWVFSIWNLFGVKNELEKN